ncbi:hypothetical protein [uncultured Ruegeria sp.]|uniref:hypothetical protein n=1 Tax=uncultured Ruegeria sp. TaxID=259304 RepID=UPI00260286A7|nr:hypothetical protein [uncultured Ruegeria sp.]
MIRLFLTSALGSGLISLPVLAHAQSWDHSRLRDEVVNSAANYTTVLRTAHTEVSKYITWKGWKTGLSEKEQEARTADILSSIEASEAITGDLVPTLSQETLASYDVKFRYCDGKLLTYFGTPDFKHNLTADQVAEAPILRSQRRGKTFAGRRIGVLEAGLDGMILALASGGQRRNVPDCLVKGDYATSLDVGTLGYVKDAPQKYGVARIRRQREAQTVACPEGEVGLGQTMRRYLSTPYSAQHEQAGDPYYDTSEGGDGNWAVTADFCREPTTIRKRNVETCDAVIRGPNRTMTVPGKGRAVYDYYVTEAQDPADFTKVVWLPSDADGNFTTSPVGILSQHSNCDNLAPTATVTPSVSTAIQNQTLGCAEPWTHGGRNYARQVTTTTYTYSGMKPDWESGLSATDVDVVRYGSWALSNNSCRRWVFSSAMQQKSTDCSCRGTVKHERVVTTKGWDWQTRADTITTTHGGWNRVSGSCEPAWRVERQGGSCNNNSSPNNGNDGGPEGREDNDGDGVNDAQDSNDNDPNEN